MEVLATQQANTSRRTPSAGDHQHGLLLRCAGSTTRKETAAVRILSTQVSQGTAYVKEMSPQQGAPSMQAYCRSACLPHKQSHHLQSPKQSCVGAICLLQQSCRTTSTNHVHCTGSNPAASKIQPLSIVVVLTAMRGAIYVLQGHMRPHAAVHLQAEVHGAWD